MVPVFRSLWRGNVIWELLLVLSDHYVSEKVELRSCLLDRLSGIVRIHPHAAYAAFTHGLCNKWTFLRTIPGISELLKSLEEVIALKFIPALVGRAVSAEERTLLALPIRLGGLGIVDPQTVSGSEFVASERVTSSLILQHKLSFDSGVLDAQRLAKSEIVLSKRQAQEEKAESVCAGLPTEMKRIISLSGDKGASSWLSILPVEENGFALHKSAFRDAICLRYGWLPSGLPAHCVCGQGFSVNHAMNCPTGGYPTIRHNELHNFTAETLSEVCTNVCMRIWRMVHEWMSVLLVFGVVAIRRLILM